VTPGWESLLATWPQGLLIAGVAFLVADAWRRWARRRGLLDVPGHRSSHVVATPRGAGVGIAVAALLGMLLLVPASVDRQAVIAGLAVVAGVGLLDDLRPLSPALKFTGQALAALPVALALPFPDGLLPFALHPGLAVAAGAAVVLLFVNAWNFMDGIDGIAALAAAAVCVGVLIAADGSPLGLSWAVVLLAACIGFLPLNFPKARAFMGDCGSHALGLGLAVLVLAAPSAESAWVPLAASAAFLVDVLGTLALRARDGERLASAHRRHLYQLVTRSGYSHARVTMAYTAWMLASGGAMAMAESAGMSGIGAASVFGVTALAWWGLGRRATRRLQERGQW
jgi:UDP-N-acetylmuramyl pentapeptide phosphotransferase/UDP-N-acetylglucosamine-1-phosphate transferase